MVVFIWNQPGEVRAGDVESNDTLSLGSTQEILDPISNHVFWWQKWWFDTVVLCVPTYTTNSQNGCTTRWTWNLATVEVVVKE